MRGTLDLHLGITIIIDHCIRHALSLLAALLVGLTHETLDGVNRVLWVGDSLTLCRVTHLTLTVLHEANHRRCSTLAFAVSNNNGFVAFKYGNTTVCCT